MSKIKEQQEALKDILYKYDNKVQKLYFDILKMFSSKSSRSSKTAIRNEILDMIKEDTK